ncbi:AAA family ATPase [Actinoplanes sp. NPDC049596]|uniref:AAA family ATPase n=1 Tax=unclassified Actinoplanes TaxID=2626549 RepID=UPI0034446859
MTVDPEGIRLCLLGPARMWHGTTETTLGTARSIAVLAVLALNGGRAVLRDQLVAALWDEAPPSAVNKIYGYVSALRQLLEPARKRRTGERMLTSSSGAYRLRIPGVDIDVFQFEALREKAWQHRAAGDPVAELHALDEALELWQGAALTGIPGPFAAAERRRLTELWLVTAERRAELLIQSGRAGEAVDRLRARPATDPARPRSRELLGTALQADRPIEAEPIGTGFGGIEAPESVPAAASLLVGRENELGRLRRAAAGLAGRTGRSIRVQGSAGMGKSALLGAALHGSVPAGGRVGWAVGSELARRIPFRVLLECLETALPGDDRCEDLRRLSDEAADGDDDVLAEAVGQAAELIRWAAAEAPLILVADDLQWADKGTVRVWNRLRDIAAELPLLLVAATRPGVARPPDADEIIELAPLSPAHATLLVHSMAAGTPDRRLIREIVAEGGGNPCYLGHLAGAGSIHPTPELISAVDVHLAPYGGATRRMLEAVAHLAAGRESTDTAAAELGELTTVTGRDRDDLRQVLAPAIRDGVLDVAGDHLAFRHRVVARVLYEGTAAPLRVMLHHSFASRLADAGRPPEHVVRQLLAGPVPMQGPIVSWLIAHIEQLSGRAPQLALATLERVRAQDAIAPADRLVITAWLARLLYRRGRTCVAEAGWVAARTDDPSVRGEMRLLIALAHEEKGDHESAAGIARAELRQAGAPALWLDRFRSLIDRIRPHLSSTAPPSLSRLATTGHDVSVNW